MTTESQLREAFAIAWGRNTESFPADIQAAITLMAEEWFRNGWQAALALPPASVWQDIATAPRDGTEVLLWWPHWSSKPHIGRYYLESYAHNKWQSDYCLSDTPVGPTHWMPLPRPPEGEKV